MAGLLGAASEETVHIVDDDPSLRVALDSLFRSVGWKTQAHEHPNTLFAMVDAATAGCLVLDVRLPGISGLDVQEQLLARGIHLPVILMTGHGDIPMSVRAMKAGAVDFLPKPFREQDMLDAVSAALERGRRRHAETADKAAVAERFARLSPREQQVMLMVTSGKMNKQVAGDIGLSEVTVKIHRRAAMQKMEARTLADLVRMAEFIDRTDRD